jgi:cytochrome c peroxidase
MPEYKEMFKKAFGNDEISFKKIADAIGVFERTLVTPSRFDEFLNGKKDALTTEEKKGLKVFIDRGCAACHTGIGIGGSMQKFPLVKPYKYANVGDFKGDKNGMVKTPTLRNVLQTAPYFHNGAVWDIKEAVKIMGETQLGVELSNEDVDAIVTFFKALDGKMPNITYPHLPAVTASTPKPEAN